MRYLIFWNIFVGPSFDRSRIDLGTILDNRMDRDESESEWGSWGRGRRVWGGTQNIGKTTKRRWISRHVHENWRFFRFPGNNLFRVSFFKMYFRRRPPDQRPLAFGEIEDKNFIGPRSPPCNKLQVALLNLPSTVTKVSTQSQGRAWARPPCWPAGTRKCMIGGETGRTHRSHTSPQYIGLWPPAF